MSNENPIPETKRGRGRPRGSKNKSPGFKHYHPKRWEPWMDALVMAKIAGAADITNEELGKRFGISSQHVSNILCAPQADEVKERARKALLSNSDRVVDRIAKIQEKALERVSAVLDNETLATNSPVTIGNFALQVMKTNLPPVKEKEDDSKDKGIQIRDSNVLIANPEYVKRIGVGLDLANQIEERRVKEISGLNEKEPLKLVANDK